MLFYYIKSGGRINCDGEIKDRNPLALGIKPPFFVRVSMLIAILSLVAQFHQISVFSRTNTNPVLRYERETGSMCVTCIETGRNCLRRNFAILDIIWWCYVATSQIKRWPYGCLKFRGTNVWRRITYILSEWVYVYSVWVDKKNIFGFIKLWELGV